MNNNNEDNSQSWSVWIDESNIKGENKPPFQREFFVICKKQNNGSWLVHKFDG